MIVLTLTEVIGGAGVVMTDSSRCQARVNSNLQKQQAHCAEHNNLGHSVIFKTVIHTSRLSRFCNTKYTCTSVNSSTAGNFDHTYNNHIQVGRQMIRQKSLKHLLFGQAIQLWCRYATPFALGGRRHRLLLASAKHTSIGQHQSSTAELLCYNQL